MTVALRSEESLHTALGLTDEEYGAVADKLGRDPNATELAMFAAMWSEHCSYKSSKVHLKALPMEGPHVLVGPGQDAPLRAKFIAGTSLVLWLAVIVLGRYIQPLQDSIAR